MSLDLTHAFQLSFVTSETALPIPAVSEILARLRSGPVWDAASIAPGERVVIKILRDGKEQDIAVTLSTREETNFRIESDPAATTEQLTIRSAWSKR